MKKVFLFLHFLFIIDSLYSQGEKKITILHTNDIHSHLTGYAPESSYSPLTTSDDNTIGGFSRIASIIKNEKENPDGITLVLDAGDFLMGTLFHAVESETGFQLRLMKSIGYDATCLGNHEFDFGPEKLAEIISASSGNGAIPSILIGNAEFDDSDSGDDLLEKLYSDNIICKKLIIERGGIKFGIFSLIGKDAVHVAPNASPVKFTKQVAYAKKIVKDLRKEKCDLVICISHSGLSKNADGLWEGEDFNLANNVKGIDVIISGHTHSRLNQPLIVNGIPIVQAGEYGSFVGKLSLGFSDGNTRVEDYRLIAINDEIAGDSNADQLIEKQKELISDAILEPLGMAYTTQVAESEFMLEGNEMGDPSASTLGPLVADAIHYYVNNHGGKGTDVSMVAAGVLRDKIVPGIQTAPDIFRVMSLGSGKDDIPGYPLSRIFVTGRELKSVLEILLVAYKSSPDNYCYYSGIRVDYNPGKRLLKKIKKISIVHAGENLVNVDFSKRNPALYSVTANSYMLQFIGIIKKMSFGLINVVPKDFEGNKITDMKLSVIDMDENREGLQEGKEWLAMIEFLSSMKDTNGNDIPDIDKKYSVPVKCFYPVNVANVAGN